MPRSAAVSPGLSNVHSAVLSKSPHLLLVSDSPRWTAAVQTAAAEMDGSAVVACDARDALVRVAGRERFSHLLIEDRCADGLLGSFAALTAADASAQTSLLVLGGVGRPHPHAEMVRSATSRSVRRALSPTRSTGGAVMGGIRKSELHEAVGSAMIEARYQPIVRIADREPVALEALARLNHPQRGTLLPDRFVPQMERAGLAQALTKSVSARVLQDVTTGALAGCGLVVTLNFSLDVLLDGTALSLLDERRQATGLPASRVVIELTESRPVEDLDTLRRSLEHLRWFGYGVSIDDVGPAVPRVRALLELPFTCLKLDMTMVRRSLHDPSALAFLQTTADAANARGMTTVAEGIESTALWDLMGSIGVGEAQGFLVARPLPAAAVPVWLDAWRETSEFATRHQV